MDAKNQLVDKLKTANNVLVTVSRNPSVDQLASCVALTLLLNKQAKHAAAVFSGEVPSTIEFLQPEATIEKNTDSLRDFIIALDKSKADKLRYKVEDNVVRIFITPYKTSISEADLEFSQGDFNVDLVVALGVGQQEELDEAITAHGRILHDATVASINAKAEGALGSINWNDPHASSLSELVTELSQALAPNLLDEQISTALLTGIVSETKRFSNEKTSPQTMSASATLMAAGANQQLVASKLEDTQPGSIQSAGEGENNEKSDGGTLAIDHTGTTGTDEATAGDQGSSFELPQPEEGESLPEDTAAPSVELPIDSSSEPTASASNGPVLTPGPKLVDKPPSLGGTLTANSTPEPLDPSVDPLSLPADDEPHMLERKPDSGPNLVPTPPESDTASRPQESSDGQPILSLSELEEQVKTSEPVPPQPPVALTPPPASWTPPPAEPPTPSLASPAATQPTDNQPAPSLSELEEQVKASEQSPPEPPADVDDARDEVNRALNSSTDTSPAPTPIQALNAQPLGNDLHPEAPPSEPSLEDQIPGLSEVPSGPSTDSSASSFNSSPPVGQAAPPPVPPPIPFQFGNPPKQ